MEFHVGPVTYTLVISDRSIFDAEGNELEGCAVEGRRLLIISRIVEPERREEIAFHEFHHAWEFHVPRPTNDEERIQLAALISQQFREDLGSQGGREAMIEMRMKRVPHLGRPAPATGYPQSNREIFGRFDRMPCATCEADVMCGSICNADPILHEPTGQHRMERWMRCDACGSLQIWTERCTADGTPTGEFVPNPRPRVLRGAEATAWLFDRELATA